MSLELTTAGITGTDGHVPLYEPDARWTTWSLDEIYIGQAGENKYVPKVSDHVLNPETNERFRVVSLDVTTMIPTMVPVVTAPSASFSDIDILLGVGPGTQSDTYRVYLDKSVIPHALCVDARLKVNGVLAKYAKIFRGSELIGNQRVVSAFYDQQGNMLGQAIPLELAYMPEGKNYAVKSVPVCHTTEDMPDGEVVTVVIYSDAGHVVSKRQLLVENSAFIRSVNAHTKYIVDITMESPFLSETDPGLLQYPLNVPTRGLNLFGIVHYSDGSTLRLPVDQTKFSVLGLDGFVATVIGQKLPLVLRYNLSNDEVSYSTVVGETFAMTKSYRGVTVQSSGAYSVKLFGYPVWVDGVVGYRLEWYLYNLERQTVYRVTPYVQYNDNTPAFDPLAYGVNQRISVSINLNNVNGVFRSYIHNQVMDIILLAQGREKTTNWTIGFELGQNPPYGRGNFASSQMVNQNLWRINVAAGATNETEWLERLYYRTKPLYDTQREVEPPKPNFFTLVFGSTEIEFPISQWNITQVINQAVPDGATLFIKFFKRTADNDLQLAIAGMPIYQQ
jgi:hypothetical protein